MEAGSDDSEEAVSELDALDELSGVAEASPLDVIPVCEHPVIRADRYTHTATKHKKKIPLAFPQLDRLPCSLAFFMITPLFLVERQHSRLWQNMVNVALGVCADWAIGGVIV